MRISFTPRPVFGCCGDPSARSALAGRCARGKGSVAALCCLGVLLALAASTLQAQTPGGDIPSSTALSLSATTITQSQPVTLTATVTGSEDEPTPTGSVTFLNGTTTLGTGTLNGSGVTTYLSMTLPVGTYVLTARYNGDSIYAGSTSQEQTLTVNAGGLMLSPATLSFGNVPVGTTSAAQVVTVTNPGATTINIAQIASELGADPAEFPQTNNCPAALGQNATCQISITFAPAAVGPASAGVAIDDDSTPSQQFIAVSGVGTGGILQVNPGNLKTIAGDGTAGYTGDGGPAVAAELNQPNGVAFDPSGNLYIADIANNIVRKVDTTGKSLRW